MKLSKVKFVLNYYSFILEYNRKKFFIFNYLDLRKYCWHKQLYWVPLSLLVYSLKSLLSSFYWPQLQIGQCNHFVDTNTDVSVTLLLTHTLILSSAYMLVYSLMNLVSSFCWLHPNFGLCNHFVDTYTYIEFGLQCWCIHSRAW